MLAPLVRPVSPARAVPRRVALAAALLASALLQGGCDLMRTYVQDPRSIGVYKLDINQGNYLSQDMVDRLKAGQSRQQVKLVLGTPLITSIFRDNRWDYVYEYKKQGQPVDYRKFTVFFVDDKLARWEGDEMPKSVVELNREASARTKGESSWADTRSWWDSVIDTFGW